MRRLWRYRGGAQTLKSSSIPRSCITGSIQQDISEVLIHRNTFADIVGTPCQEVSWQADGVQSAADSSCRAHKSSIRKSAHGPRASASANGAGSRLNVKQIPPTRPGRRSMQNHGPSRTQITRATTELKILTMLNAIAHSKKSATQSAATRRLQRWTCQDRKALCRLAFTGLHPLTRQKLQRWMCG